MYTSINEWKKTLVKESKEYYIQNNVGDSKYVVNYHDGKKTHKDGSKFYDMKSFTNKLKRDEFIKELNESGRVALETLNSIDNYDEAESFLAGLIDRDLRDLASIILSKPKAKRMSPQALMQKLLDYWKEEN